ncbi:hypothetical protein [Bradyrhizobium vignae]|uniref:hypothetical protein n=1 Tax=Bradyrhizobium vignae TaxID=1549949 RepID=UPI00100A659C|nr:hypothetical protein [Bradyrhizobium vignae]RXG84173.1 hypothetical protein EAV90_37710 [Bradyrhizobium vignae]
MVNTSPHEEEPKGESEHRKSSFWATAAVWFGSSLLLYLALQVLALVGLRATVSHWNEESLHALASYQLFEWWECTPQRLGTQCANNPLIYLLSSRSLFELAIKILQLIAGTAFLLWITGVKTASPRELLVALAVMLVFVMILFAIPFALGAVLALLNAALYFIGLGDQLRGLALTLLSFLALPIAIPVGLITIAVLAATTLVSVPVLIISYVVSGVLEEVLPEKPTLPLVLGSLTATTFHCLGSGSEATLHEYLKHVLLRFTRTLRS